MHREAPARETRGRGRALAPRPDERERVKSHARAVAATCFAVGLVLSGCAAQPSPPGPPAIPAVLYPPWTLNQTPEEIALRWYPDATPSAAAQQTAQLHCSAWNKSAVLVSDTLDGSAEIAQYHCR
jgi:hypothetical protein